MNEAPGMDVITILKITQTSEHFLNLIIFLLAKG